MSRVSRDVLWRRLTDAGVVQGDPPPPDAAASPWYIRTMLGIAGWIGALFLLAFVGAALSSVFDSSGAALVIGAFCCGAAYFIFRNWSRNDVAMQFGLAVSLAGQVMIIFAIGDTLGQSAEGVPFLLAIAILEGVLAFVLDNYVHRAMCTIAATIALGLAIRQMGLDAVFPAALAAALATVWLNERQFGSRGPMWRAIGNGLAIGLLIRGFSFWESLGWRHDVVFMPWMFWASGLLLGAVLLHVVQQLLAQHDVAPSSRVGAAALGAAAVFAIPTFTASGVIASLIVMLLGFARGNRVMFGLGVAALLGYLSYFYYTLLATLLTKSIMLMATGAVLVAAWFVMRAMFGDAPARERAHA